MNFLHVVLVILLGAVVSGLLTFLEIPFLKNHQFKQYIREEGPASHQKKAGTPTMGGIAMIAALVILTFVVVGVSSTSILMLIVTIVFGGIGFMDDYIKVAAKHNLGLTAKQKLALQLVFGIALGIYIKFFTELGTAVYIPFYGKQIDFGILYIPFVAFVLVAMANSVNLTDGLDGLCSGVTAIVAFFFALMGIKLGQAVPTSYSAALCGVCLGFLVFNKNPAKLFMGDTGSMALGSAVAVIAIVMKMEFFLVIAGFIYVMESLSVIIQVISFQTRGKRIFRMSPIHHHFELGGMAEKNVVFMFWGVAAVCCVLAYLIFSINA